MSRDESGYTDRPCSVVNQGCKAPANGADGTRGSCFACGEPVCTSVHCSRIVTWAKGRRRVCERCLGFR